MKNVFKSFIAFSLITTGVFAVPRSDGNKVHYGDYINLKSYHNSYLYGGHQVSQKAPSTWQFLNPKNLNDKSIIT